MQDYLKEFKIITSQLLSCGVKISEEELQTYVLNGLPPANDVFCATIQTQGLPLLLQNLSHFLFTRSQARMTNRQNRKLQLHLLHKACEVVLLIEEG
jgi:hypothetical protein